jgi:hypothetical protein
MGKKNFVLLPSQTTCGYGTSGIAYDSLTNEYVCKYQLYVGIHTVKLDKIYRGVKSFWEWMGSVTTIEPQQLKKYEWGQPSIVFSTIKDS